MFDRILNYQTSMTVTAILLLSGESFHFQYGLTKASCICLFLVIDTARLEPQALHPARSVRISPEVPLKIRP